MKNDCFFSVLIPSYNRPEYIVQCVQSILNSSFKMFEIIVSDDNSPKQEEIKAALSPYILAGQIQFFQQEKNLREPGNKQFLVEKASGQYNIIIGDDDLLEKNALQILFDYIARFPEIDLFAVGYKVIDENDSFQYERYAPKELTVDIDNCALSKHLFYSDIFPFWLYHPATFCCKSGVELELGYSAEAGIGEDFLFMFEFIASGRKLLSVPYSLFKWRKIQNNDGQHQLNQSLIDNSNLVARNNILNYLTREKDLDKRVIELVNSLDFRQVFLYGPIISERNDVEDVALELELSSQYKSELMIMVNKMSFFSRKYKPYFRRAYNFISIFGIKGFIQISFTFYQRLKYKVISRV